MFKSKRFITATLIALAAITLFTTTLLLSPTNVLAKKNKARIKGLITAIDAGAGTVTIQDRKSGEAVTVTIDSATRIRKDHIKHATLADLNIGDQAKARYQLQTMLAKRIKATSPKLQGIITAINLAAQTVAIQSGESDPVTVSVTGDTKIRRNGKKATLADLVVGDYGKARFDAQTMQASKIRATSQTSNSQR